MLVGEKYVNCFFTEMKMNYYFKITEELYLDKNKEKKKNDKKLMFLEKYFNHYIIKKNFSLPISPTYKCFRINDGEL